MSASVNPGLDPNTVIDQLERDGYVVIPGVLSPEEVQGYRDAMKNARKKGWEDGTNIVGNMYFNRLLEQDPDTFQNFLAHPKMRPYLEELFGPQCQVRSLRGHINPGAYSQEWHMDFYAYWDEFKARYAQRPVSINATFYLNDNAPGVAWLRFLRGGHKFKPEGLNRNANPYDKNGTFHQWCESQPQDVVYPKAGDVVLFFSHIPHRGAKEDPNAERSNVVVHYQCNAMYEGIWHVSTPMGFEGTFPLAEKSKKKPVAYYSSRILHKSFLYELRHMAKKALRGAVDKIQL